jgi:hypothetical protein
VILNNPKKEVLTHPESFNFIFFLGFVPIYSLLNNKGKKKKEKNLESEQTVKPSK